MKLSDVSVRRPVLATVMTAVLVVFGISAYPKVGVDLMPDVEFPIIAVTAVYPGADPETIESKVIDKLEEGLSTVSGLKMLRATAMENVGMVIIQFELERKVDQCAQDVRDKLSAIQRELPPDLEPPVVEKFDVGAMPILSIAIGAELPIRELTEIADEKIRQKLQAVNGVGRVDLVGGREREFHVWIDPQRLESQWLAVGDVAQALAAQNVEIPGGRLDVGAREFSVKTRGQVHSKQELEDIIITSAMGAPIRIRDVARVEDEEEEERSYSSLNGKSAVALVVNKQSGANTVEVARRLRAELELLKPQFPNLKFEVPADNSVFISNVIHDVQIDLVYGGILAILIVLFFLHDWRATFISALALPTSVIATFAFIQAMGFTFNTMTMLALSLSIGILIDDAIVVIENIHRHMERGAPPMRAAREATAEIGLAVTATTASILAVFVPVATMKGMVGRFFLQFGLTVAFAVTVSLFVAFTLTPMLAARMLRESSGKGPVGRAIDVLLGWVDRVYRVILGAALRQRFVTLLFATGAMAATMFVARNVPFEFMPDTDQGAFSVKVELPMGTAFDVTKRYAEELSGEIRKMPGVVSTFVTVGGGALEEVQKAQVDVKLVPKKDRAFSQAAAMQYVRDLIATRKDRALVSVEELALVSGGAAMKQTAVQFNIRGRDYDDLNRAAEAVIAELRAKGGFVDLDTSYRGGKPEVTITIDRDAAAERGVPVAMLAMTIRSFFAGDKATELATDGNRYDVRVKLDPAYRRRPEDILALKVRSTTGQLVHLSTVVKVATGTGAGMIERQDRQRQVTIYANLQGKALGTAVDEVNAIAARVVPKDLKTGWTGMGDVMKESFKHLLEALILAILIVYLVLAAQFESFVHPFTIMLSLPLSLVGAVGALALTGQPLGIMAMIGVILLMGLVTKNAILLVDYTNKLREQGMGKTEALLAAGPVRLRPILMTTLAMILGMVPVAFAMSEGSEMRAPMAIGVIGGLTTSTLLTLVVVPVVYSLLDRGKDRRQLAVAEDAPSEAAGT